MVQRAEEIMAMSDEGKQGSNNWEMESACAFKKRHGEHLKDTWSVVVNCFSLYFPRVGLAYAGQEKASVGLAARMSFLALRCLLRPRLTAAGPEALNIPRFNSGSNKVAQEVVRQFQSGSNKVAHHPPSIFS